MFSIKTDANRSIPLFNELREAAQNMAEPFAVLRRLNSPVWIFDIDNSRICFANTAACELWQADDEAELMRRDFGADMTATVANRLAQYQMDFHNHDAKFSEVWTLYPKGVPTTVEVDFAGVYLPDGRMAMLCEVRDVTDGEPENLRSAEALLHTDVMITLYEQDGPPFYMNPSARAATENPRHDISRKFVDAGDYTLLKKTISGQGEHRMVALVHTSEGPRWHDLAAKTCRDAVTGQPAVLVTETDVSALKNARDTARYLADRDQLTGCFNRTYLLEHFSKLQSTDGFALACIDVDHFKQINDRFGHEMGDLVLKEIVGRLSGYTGDDDLLVRLGGDEFVLLVARVEDEVDLRNRLNGILRSVSVPLIHDSTRMSVSISMGVAQFSPGLADFDEVLRRADIALYQSKAEGRNRVTFFNAEMGAAVAARDEIELDLKKSIKNKDFCLHFQPQVSLLNGKVVSVEGLVRWAHPQRGIVFPGEFIPVCEETGMIEELGQQVLEMGCEQAMSWSADGVDLGVSINISPRQFKDPTLMPMLRRIARRADFPTGKIVLEVTESVLIGDLASIGQQLHEIAGMGYRIAIDDFGTGFSNLSYISTFPVHCLKIDRSFVEQLPRSGPVISLILTLAREIGATVICEGIETHDQLDWLKAQGCEQVQGYLMSKPVAVDRLVDVVSEIDAATW